MSIVNTTGRFSCRSNAPESQIIKCKVLNLINNITPYTFTPSNEANEPLAYEGDSDFFVIHEQEQGGTEIAICLFRDKLTSDPPTFEYFVTVRTYPHELKAPERVVAPVDWRGAHRTYPDWKDAVGALKGELENYQVNGEKIARR